MRTSAHGTALIETVWCTDGSFGPVGGPGPEVVFGPPLPVVPIEPGGPIL